MDDERRKQWERAMEWPLVATAILFLGAWAWPILNPDLPRGWANGCHVAVTATWLAFAIDYMVRFVLAGHRATFVRGSLPDLASVAAPLLRPLRLLRLIRVLGALDRAAGASLRGRVAVYVAGSMTLVLFVASLAVLDAERGKPGASINTFADALWWAFTTVTTVGYGDRYPVTGAGRLVAIGLMLAGIALLGVVTAATASWLLDRVAAADVEAQAATRRDLAALSSEIAQLRQELLTRSKPDLDVTGPELSPPGVK
jgi:voltage-gated potassium channel